MQNFGVRLSGQLLDILFPKECVGCGREGSWLCNSCGGTIYINDKFFCPNCRRETIFGNTCGQCLNDGFALDSLIFVARYGDRYLQKLIHNFKYRYCESIAHDLGKILQRFFLKYQNVMPKADLITSVPLHGERLGDRGFNQSALLGRKISELSQIQFQESLIKRVKNNRPQIELNDEERAANVLNIFEAPDPEGVFGKTILLVDDVYTTGATLTQGARVLKAAGARAVHGFVLARS